MSGYRYTGIQVTGNRQSVLQVTGKSTQAHLDRFCIDFGLDEPMVRTRQIGLDERILASKGAGGSGRSP